MDQSQRTLVIDTPTPACSVALFENGKLTEHHYETPGRGHAELLPLMLSRLPDAGRADHILVNCGPGSFTGLRVGLAAARALALVWQASLAGYTTHSLVAQMALKNLPDNNSDRIDIVMNAGHGQIFWQAFNEQARAITEIESLYPQDVLQKCSGNIIAGNAIGQLDGHNTCATVFQQMQILPDAACAMNMSPDQVNIDARPVYIRSPDAKPAGKPDNKASKESRPC